MEHVLQLLKGTHQEAGTQQGDDVAQSVEDRKGVESSVEEQGEATEEGQQDAHDKEYTEPLYPSGPTEGGHFVDLERQQRLVIKSSSSGRLLCSLQIDRISYLVHYSPLLLRLVIATQHLSQFVHPGE